jgi:hypothetical protein
VKHGAVKGTELRAIVRDATWRDVAHPLRTPGRRAA